MRKTIKELENDLEHAKKSRDDYYQNWKNLEAKYDKKFDERIGFLKDDVNRMNNTISTLREIIRWQINPETAKSPFMPTKEQRDDRVSNGIY